MFRAWLATHVANPSTPDESSGSQSFAWNGQIAPWAIRSGTHLSITAHRSLSRTRALKEEQRHDLCTVSLLSETQTPPSWMTSMPARKVLFAHHATLPNI
ncbi:hypothetical protein KCU61_g495, partial [Aureobasidium melanogenum]